MIDLTRYVEEIKIHGKRMLIASIKLNGFIIVFFSFRFVKSFENSHDRFPNFKIHKNTLLHSCVNKVIWTYSCVLFIIKVVNFEYSINYTYFLKFLSSIKNAFLRENTSRTYI